MNSHEGAGVTSSARRSRLIDHWSIEVMPRTAAKIADFRLLCPGQTRIYLAHIDGTPLDDMVATARRLNREGFAVMPHLPARSLAGRAELQDLLSRYRNEADVRQALLLAGGNATACGMFTSSIDMIETGLFDAMGFTDLHVAGHPEGNRDIERDGTTKVMDAALLTKQDYASRTDARMAITTQFAFDAQGIIRWVERLASIGVTLPVHVGVAGPAKLQTLIKYALSCGVGPSLSILQKRALDVTRLLTPYEPTDLVQALEAYKVNNPDSLLDRIHLFPLGGIEASANWARKTVG
ncbi:methylenetetrahydrofolate reductase [Rhizobium sp. FY34]|uniref:methylenetetrahydrofolate reductase n=1 Tax=Rhizobium sp. FY34 TaxID=2562309 RepID=UPI001FEDB42F|nr:methylenetetrahydrofolate reductase [Rhizobium sp. FY34]